MIRKSLTPAARSRARTGEKAVTLVLADRWRDGERAKGTSDLDYLWQGGVEHFSHLIFFYPDCVSRKQAVVDRKLLELAARHDLRRILYLPTFRQERVADYFPSLHVLDYLVSEKGCSLILLSPDWCSGQMRRYAAESLGHLLSCNLVLDLPRLPSGFSRFPRSVALWPPADESRFFLEEARPTDVLFIGTINAKRRLLLESLGEMPGRKLVIRERGVGRAISPEEYGRMTRKSKIVLNQCAAYGLEQEQLKGRITEALASGCCLLDDSLEQTPAYFLPGRDYIQYRKPEEVRGLVQDLLESGGWKEIGERGHRTYRDEYSQRSFWDRVLAEIRDFSAAEKETHHGTPGLASSPFLGLVATFHPGDVFLERWVDQLMRQDSMPDEVVCTSRHFSERERKCLERIPGVRLVERPDRCAWEGILNALRASTARHVLISLSDERLMPKALRTARAAALRSEDADVLVGQIWDCDEHGQRNRLVKPNPDRDRFDLLAGKVMLPLSASIFRRSALVSVGLHGTDWKMDCGEYELWLRLLARDRIRTIPVCLAEYPSRKESLSLGAKNRAVESRGRIKCAFINLHEVPFRPLRFSAKINLMRLLLKRAFWDSFRAFELKIKTENKFEKTANQNRWHWASWLRSLNCDKISWKTGFSILQGNLPPPFHYASLEQDAEWLLSHRGGCIVGKIGTTELLALEFSDRWIRPPFPGNFTWKRPAQRLFTNAGFFPLEKKEFYGFLSSYRQALQHLDGIFPWQTEAFLALYESALVCQNLPHARLLNGLTLSPCLAPHLSHLRWLVVSPFVKTMKSQLAKLGKIHPPGRGNWRDTARHCRFIACPLAASLVSSPYSSWSSGLADLQKKITEADDFDVLIVGAGAWSLPLLMAAKSRGKIGIHMGGTTQNIFGIKGGRWDSHGIYTRHWVRPSPEETPSERFKIESGCYW